MTETVFHLQKIKRELLCFIVIGVLATLTDFIVYWMLHTVLFYSLAKTISFLSGSIVAYFLNKFITFKQKHHSAREIMRFAALYASTLIINVAVNSLAIILLTQFSSAMKFDFNQINITQTIIVFSFLGATAVSMVLNFIGQKYWVFKRHL